ncbi:hypothetical protein ABEB36_005207 [Hypothenemus hampei]|uniref:Uncharacterized protein n=1 Tax=Hypothenemus hampei TaxID=57062 RepID=A0ABD1F0E5_HYPHA
MKKYVSSIELKSIWDKLPESHKTSPILKLNLPCLKHFNDTSDSVTQFDGPPPPIKACSTLNQTLYCNTPSELQFENPDGNLTLSSVIQKLKIVFKNGTVVELSNKWNKLPIPSAFFNFHTICLLLAILILCLALVYKLFLISREYLKRKIDAWCSTLIWDKVFTSLSRNPPKTMQTSKRIVPDKVFPIGHLMQILYTSNAQTPQITLKYINKKPIKFTYEEFTKFLDFVYGFITNGKEKEEEEEEEMKWCDFVIGQYIFLTYWTDKNNTCSLAIQDTHNTDFVTLNKQELKLFLSEKYNLYEFLKK